MYLSLYFFGKATYRKSTSSQKRYINAISSHEIVHPCKFKIVKENRLCAVCKQRVKIFIKHYCLLFMSVVCLKKHYLSDG